jgi:hypothetical protein
MKNVQYTLFDGKCFDFMLYSVIFLLYVLNTFHILNDIAQTGTQFLFSQYVRCNVMQHTQDYVCWTQLISYTFIVAHLTTP